MPKEVILDYNSSDDTTKFKTVVGWTRDMDVQLGVVRSVKEGEHQDDKGDGWYVTLDRADINNLIRHLRKARDQAYGADA